MTMATRFPVSVAIVLPGIGVPVVVGVPVDELAAPTARMEDVVEVPRVIWLLLEGLEA